MTEAEILSREASGGKAKQVRPAGLAERVSSPSLIGDIYVSLVACVAGTCPRARLCPPEGQVRAEAGVSQGGRRLSCFVSVLSWPGVELN